MTIKSTLDDLERNTDPAYAFPAKFLYWKLYCGKPRPCKWHQYESLIQKKLLPTKTKKIIELKNQFKTTLENYPFFDLKLYKTLMVLFNYNVFTRSIDTIIFTSVMADQSKEMGAFI